MSMRSVDWWGYRHKQKYIPVVPAIVLPWPVFILGIPFGFFLGYLIGH